ncbi:MAG: AAA family ATPase [Acidimicrobiaceae bacterium]|nr:AAA family ATPase [Acidimicrobiaceae bacterium]
MNVANPNDEAEMWEQRLEQYLGHRREQGISSSTISSDRSIIGGWIEYALPRGKDPGLRDSEVIQGFLGRTTTDKSSASYRSHLNEWFKYLAEDRGPGARNEPGNQPDWDAESEYWEDRLWEYLEHLRDQGCEESTIDATRRILDRWTALSLSQGSDPGVFDEAQVVQLLSEETHRFEGSLNDCSGHIRRWCEYLEAHQDDETELWWQRLEEYVEHMHEGGVEDSLVNARQSVVHRWIEYALTHGESPGSFDEALVNVFLDERYLLDSTREIQLGHIQRWCRFRESRTRTPNAWVVRAGAEGQDEQSNLDQSVVSLGYAGFPHGDIHEYKDRRELGEALELGPDATEGQIRAARDQIWRFAKEIQIGDLVVMPQKRPELSSRLIAIGRVLGPYEGGSREVEWLQADIPREEVKDDLRASVDVPRTVFGLRKHDAPYRIGHLAEHGVDPGDRNPPPEDSTGADQTRSDRLEDAAEELLCKVSFLEEIVGLLKDKGQVILYGPPGTGKTYLAQKLAEALAPEEQARSLVQFHPAYSYEDFFEGYRPVTDGDQQMTYQLTPGPLAKLAEHAEDHPEQQHVMVIDEINRANLPRVLGELLFLLEYRDKSMAVMHRPDDSFKLPKNLWFIGTMNTADRSIALIDAAMRRRFHFVPFLPEDGPMAGLLRRWTDENAPEQDWVVGLVSDVNKELSKELGGDHLQLGPSHFMKDDLDEEGFKRVWKYNIEPFIEDQLFGNRDKIDSFRSDAVLRRHGPAELMPQEADLADDPEPTSAVGRAESLGLDGDESGAVGE